MTEQIRVPQVNFEPIILGGGWDQTTPILNLKSGVVKYALNFECAPSGGYARVSGYERFDGQGSPTDSSTSSVYLSVTAFSSVPTVGQTLTASGGATGVIAYISGQVMVLCKVTGTFAVAETVSVGATLIGTVNNVNAGPSTPLQSALGKNAAVLERLPPGKALCWATDESVLEASDTTFSAVNLTLYPMIAAPYDGVAGRLRVVREPINDFTSSNMAAVPEIPASHHLDMLDWAGYLALRSPDTDVAGANAFQRAQDLAGRFEVHCKDAWKLAMRKMFAQQEWAFGHNGWSWES